MGNLEKQLDTFLRKKPKLGRSVYIAKGASVLGDIMASREDFWITKAMYAEEGAARLVERFSSAKTA
jgi:hypothetical protein